MFIIIMYNVSTLYKYLLVRFLTNTFSKNILTQVDPFKVKTGGLINMSALKTGQVTQVDDAYDTGIGTQFSAETNKRDEDEEM